MHHLHHVHGEVVSGELLRRVLLVLNLEMDSNTRECLQLNILFDSGGSRTYVTLKLAGLDRVSDADVILQSLQSDHLPFGLLEFCFVLLLKRQIKPFKISQDVGKISTFGYFLDGNWTFSCP